MDVKQCSYYYYTRKPKDRKDEKSKVVTYGFILAWPLIIFMSRNITTNLLVEVDEVKE